MNNTATLAVANGDDFAQEKNKVTVKVRFFQECAQRKIHPLFPRTDQQRTTKQKERDELRFLFETIDRKPVPGSGRN